MLLPLPSPESAIEPTPARAGAYSARVPLLRAAAAQCGAFLLIMWLLALVPVAALGPGDVLAWALLQGLVAAALGRGMDMDAWWFPIHILFVPGLVWMLALDLSPLYWLAAFCLLASVYWSVLRTRVPLFLSSRAAARALSKLLPREHGFSFVDLGSGLGGLLGYLARARPAGSYHGIEAAPVPFLLSWLRVALGARSCSVSWGDFQKLDLGRYDVVYAYLSPAAMPDLWAKARREMRAGSLLISNSFSVPGVAPARIVATGVRDGASLLLWRM